MNKLLLLAGFLSLTAFALYQHELPTATELPVAPTTGSSLKVDNEYKFPVTLNPQMTVDGRTLQSGSTTAPQLQGTIQVRTQ